MTEKAVESRALDSNLVSRGATKPPARSRTSLSIGAVAIVLVCTLLAIVSAAETRFVNNVHGTPIPWQHVFWTTAPRWGFLAATLPVVYVATLRWPPWPVSLRALIVQAGLFAGLSLSYAAIDGYSVSLVLPYSASFGFGLRMSRAWMDTQPLIMPLYAATVLLAWGMEQLRARRERELRASQLEAQLHAARLAALRSQLHPHFLYNTLNGISALVADREQDRASGALEQLAELLHAAFREDGRALIPLAEEVALAERYLALQQLRFGDRLEASIRLAPETRACVLPPLILQPLVENAVLHGLARRTGRMQLTLSATVVGGETIITIRQDGPALPLDWSAASRGGVGLANTRARLASAFDERASLDVTRQDEGGVVARMRIPLPEQAMAEAARDATRTTHATVALRAPEPA